MTSPLMAIALAVCCLIGLIYGWCSRRRAKKLREELDSEAWDDYLGI